MARKKTKTDVYQQVTDRIIAQLEQGVAPWVRPWAAGGLHRSGRTGRVYRGINQVLLAMQAVAEGYGDNRWITFKQAKDLGGHVRKGERGTPIVFWKFGEVQVTDAAGEPVTDASGEPVTERKLRFTRFFTVFNVEQCDGLDTDQLPSTEREGARGADLLAEADRYIEATGATIRHGGDRAFYSLTHDAITLPERDRFHSTAGYYSTAFHELTHWTGHDSRCARTFGERFGDSAYAAEELVAEMGSAFLCAAHGIEGSLQHPEYIGHWLAVLKADKTAIFTAASKAQQAVDHLDGLAAAETTEAAEAA